MVSVRYLNQNGTEDGIDEDKQSVIKFVEVSIPDYTHNLIIPLWGEPIKAPAFTTTLPSESLGAVPTYPGEDPIDPDCHVNF
jgi:hypothetical protein